LTAKKAKRPKGWKLVFGFKRYLMLFFLFSSFRVSKICLDLIQNIAKIMSEITAVPNTTRGTQNDYRNSKKLSNLHLRF